MRTVRITIACLALAAAKPVIAQDTTTSSTLAPIEGWLAGISVGVPGYGHQALPEAFTVSFSATDIRPGRLGADFSFGVIPRAAAEGVVVAVARLNAALALPAGPNVVVLPTAGFSGIAGMSEGGGGALPGLNAGLSVLLGNSSLRLRGGVTAHYFPLAEGPIWHLELGLANLPMLGRRSARP